MVFWGKLPVLMRPPPSPCTDLPRYKTAGLEGCGNDPKRNLTRLFIKPRFGVEDFQVGLDNDCLAITSTVDWSTERALLCIIL